MNERTSTGTSTPPSLSRICVRANDRSSSFASLSSAVATSGSAAAVVLRAQAPNTIYAYAIGDWRNGPVVTISPLFETTEAFTTPQLIARVKKEFAPFATISDIDIQRFATVEEGVAEYVSWLAR